MYAIILIDDEIPTLNELKYMLSDYKLFNIIGSYLDPIEGLEAIKVSKPDVVFLDINMPELDGFCVAEILIKLPSPPLIVFVTAYDEYAIRAFKVNAIDYILKPVMDDTLSQTMEKITLRLKEQKRDSALSENLNNLLKSNKAIKKIPVWKNDRIYLIDTKDIFYFSVIGGNTIIHTKDTQYLTQEPLNTFEEQLSEQDFYRCHRSYLIQIDKINEIIPWFNNTYVVKFEGIDEEIPISRRNIKEFKKHFHLF